MAKRKTKKTDEGQIGILDENVEIMAAGEVMESAITDTLEQN